MSEKAVEIARLFNDDSWNEILSNLRLGDSQTPPPYATLFEDTLPSYYSQLPSYSDVADYTRGFSQDEDESVGFDLQFREIEEKIMLLYFEGSSLTLSRMAARLRVAQLGLAVDLDSSASRIEEVLDENESPEDPGLSTESGESAVTDARRPVPQIKRVHCRCHCGHTFVDEYLELQVDEVERSGTSSWHTEDERDDGEGSSLSFRVPNAGSETRSSTSGKISRSPVNSASKFVSGLWRSFQPKSPSLPYSHSDVGKDVIVTLAAPAETREVIFLLLCVPHRKFATKLLQPELSHVRSDQEFFKLLKRAYKHIRGRWRSWLSLKTLGGIKFVQFELYRSELVDVQKQDDLPPASRRQEYRYRPCPPKRIPPVSEEHMLHLMAYPDHAEDIGCIVDRIPKKLREPLAVCPQARTGIGWGIRFIEDWHSGIITLIAYGLLVAASLVFLVCWSVFKHDLQGAAGVAAYLTAFVSLTIGSVQAIFEFT